MNVFFDTEFTELGVDPKLISIGLVSEDGNRTFYAELDDTYELSDTSDFVRLAVLPLLEGGNKRMSMARLAIRLRHWVEGFEQPVMLVTDSLAWDWPWIHEIFCDRWPENLTRRPLLLKDSTLVNYESFVDATEEAFKTLRRHHALDDAQANRLGWIAACGFIPAYA